MANMLERFAVGCFKLAARALFARLALEASIPPTPRVPRGWAEVEAETEGEAAARAWAAGRTGGVGTD